MKADRTILWIADADMQQLPAGVLALRDRGLEIRRCDDLRSYKKLVPALEAFPSAFIVTADDDLYYSRNWLESLAAGVDLSRHVIVCHRAHRPARSVDGALGPYEQWEFEVQDGSARSPSADIVPTSGAGALYPPDSLHPIVTDRSQFQRLCPNGDDLWFYWCARMAGTLHKKIGGSVRLVTWARSQDSSLWDGNERGGNDRMIRALEAEFGTPAIA